MRMTKRIGVVIGATVLFLSSAPASAATAVLADSVMEGALRGALIGGAVGAVVGVIMWAFKKNKKDDNQQK